MLNAANVLIVEDEYLIAIELQRILEAAGAASVWITGSFEEGSAQALENRLDLALVSLGAEPQLALDLIQSLLSEGLVVVAVSSDASHQYGIPGFPNVPCIIKPFTDQDVLTALSRARDRS